MDGSTLDCRVPLPFEFSVPPKHLFHNSRSTVNCDPNQILKWQYRLSFKYSHPEICPISLQKSNSLLSKLRKILSFEISENSCFQKICPWKYIRNFGNMCTIKLIGKNNSCDYIIKDIYLGIKLKLFHITR